MKLACFFQLNANQVSVYVRNIKLPNSTSPSSTCSTILPRWFDMTDEMSSELDYHTQDDPMEHDQVASTPNFQQEVVPTKKRFMKPRSKVWRHFTKIQDQIGGSDRSRCNYCSKEYVYSSRNGTSSLISHLSTCPKKPSDSAQVDPHSGSGGNEGNMVICKADHSSIRKAIVDMIILDELPFRFVESEGFQRFMHTMCPGFPIPSRFTVVRDCLGRYVDVLGELKTYFKVTGQRISITTDTWTSNQNLNYMCLIAHFIDRDWKLNKKILNFCPIPSHKGEACGKEVERCLRDWDIEKVFTLTVDNAPSNDNVVIYLKKKLGNKSPLFVKGELFHMRCGAHITNLIVKDGLKDIDISISRVREAIKYVKASSARYKKFEECAKFEKIESKRILCLDVNTRWNSTYLMLDIAQPYERAFERYADQDGGFASDLTEPGASGVPTKDDWNNCRHMVKFLKCFYDLTVRISGTSYATSNIFFNQVNQVYMILKKWKVSPDVSLCAMATRMMNKFAKYWGDVNKQNLLMFIAIVFDPRYKFNYLWFCLKEMYEVPLGDKLAGLTKNVLVRLYEEYKGILQPSNTLQQVVKSPTTEDDDHILESLYKKHKFRTGSSSSKHELEKYLDEDPEDGVENFNILLWWKVNSHRFPILSHMARDILAVPVTTVASESAFSTGGRLLDPYRSSLTPNMVEALICAEDWIRHGVVPFEITGDPNDLNTLETELARLTTGNTVPSV